MRYNERWLIGSNQRNRIYVFFSLLLRYALFGIKDRYEVPELWQ